MDIAKSKRRNNVIIIICILVLVSISLFTEKRDVVVYHTRWNVKNNSCRVSFIIKNNTRKNIWTNVTITAKAKGTGGAGPFGGQVVGEKSLAIVLKPDETKKISEIILVSAKPEGIRVKLWKPE